ncbi:hypothetical protein FHS51_001887 [Sphingobium wenxiniae]|uniref:Uncharacterized protein n=2 Tax=Sphingobium TaxID=165695 RepID=T0GDC2_9SPHN|nr:MULTISPECIES: hypothetical protein [Sphingobium]EQB01756.1 hypothetical protein L485_10075 [Sphingobium baderi LL03]KMS62346.1 hypothetical protein V475_08395 [Sphingobium baderi LL03]MBB6191659.1 hypothetical protein [Sphingobium wenxiniae]TWH92742.1 hypothetical protein IQ35_02401 [Sphingobium wenxiniae]WRD76502.1 hypothetical protein QQ987_17450 [Sphingobium baderi]
MNGELRALGVIHGLLLGMVLATPWMGAYVMRWGVEALFIMSAFQLRLADRRFALRPGWRGWISHVRMAPQRLATWAALAIAVLIALPDRTGMPAIILMAALMGELLLYPACVWLLPRLSRRYLGWLLAMMLLSCAMTDRDMLRLPILFITGIGVCLFWLRGPDGDVHALAAALGAGGISALAAILWPVAAPVCVPAATVAVMTALAHMSVMRRRPHHWRLGGDAAGIRLRRLRLLSRPF